jgi:hypothetical protein
MTRIDTLAVKRNGPIELRQQLSVCVCYVFGTDATTLLALCEDVIRWHLSVDEVHQQRTAYTIVRT